MLHTEWIEKHTTRDTTGLVNVFGDPFFEIKFMCSEFWNLSRRRGDDSFIGHVRPIDMNVMPTLSFVGRLLDEQGTIPSLDVWFRSATTL